MSSANEIAVTVIGGYLGAGKTTLVNHILRTADERVAVLVNDFGSVNIDAELIERQDGDAITLTNGCICCSLVDGLGAALTTIKELDPRPQRLVIEASGVADPATVAAYGHGPGLALDAVVVVADAETVRTQSKDKYVGDTVIGQLRSADIVIANKLDLIDADQAAAVRAWLQETNSDAVIVDAEQSEVSPALLFGEASGTRQPPEGGPPVEGHEHDGHATGLHGDSVFESWTWESDSPLPRQMIEQLMAATPERVVRLKGVVTLDERPDRVMILQRVGGRWSLRPGAKSQGSEASLGTCRLVAIGLTGAIDHTWFKSHLGSG